jgi:hypothetical protein
MIGDTLTPTGTPALASVSTVRSRRCGAAARGLEDARERRVQRGDGHVHGHQPVGGHGRHEVEVALDARRLGDQREGMAAFGQDLDDRARDAELALDRLVGIGGGSDVEHHRPVAAAREGLAKLLGRIHLGDDPGFEVQPGDRLR